MTNEERFKKYIEYNCKICKNRKTNLCDIRISVVKDSVITKCDHYEREN